MTSIHSIPREILIHIFSYYLETEKQLDLIYNVSQVCQDWKEVCMDSSLWRTFDGSLPLCFLKKFCKEGYLKNVELFKFCKTEKTLSSKELQSIYENLARLKSIDFSKASWMLEEKECRFFIYLIPYCPELCEIVLREKWTRQAPRLHHELLENFLRIRGTKLKSLNFSNTSVSGLKELFMTIAFSCPNLEDLKAQNLRNCEDGFPIGDMQNGLKKLRVLRLGSPVKIRDGTCAPKLGFPNLHTFTHPSRSDYEMSNLCFRKLVMKSPDLRVLDIRGRYLVKSNTVYHLPTENLEGLYVSCTNVYQCAGFEDIVMRWGHSLAALDVSRMTENCINNLFGSLISFRSLQNLEILYLNNTTVTKSTVKLIIQNCPKLNFLDLVSCRSLGRGQKRKYLGQVEIKELLNQLEAEGGMELS